MVTFVVGGTIERANRGNTLLIRENPEVSLAGKIFGALGGTAFLAGALFFWHMPVEDTGEGVIWVRIALCGGLAAIGAILGWSALWPRKSITQIEVDSQSREVRIGTVKPEADWVCKHTVTFAAIKRFYAGSETSRDVSSSGGSTVLYMEAEGGPRNGVVLVGAVAELEPLARELNDVLESPVIAAPDANISQPARTSGFGRRGL